MTRRFRSASNRSFLADLAAPAALAALLCVVATPMPASAQDVRPGQVLSSASLRRAVDAAPRQSIDPRSQWSRVVTLKSGTGVTVVIDKRPALHGQLESVDAGGLRVRLDDGRVEPIARTDVAEVRALGRRRGSRVGAVIGAGAGAFLGLVGAMHLAFKQCNGSCTDEKVLMGTSLVGAPIGGGLLGYYGFGSSRRSETVYLRP